MDPLDRLSVPTPAMPDGASGDGSAAGPAAEYGHVPFLGKQDGSAGSMAPAVRTQARRDVFWSNVVREILMALASAAAHSSGRLDTGPSAARASTSPVDDLFDGRMGVITTLGQRIPIADIMPVFACSMPGCDADRSRSNDVQCTVYRITTPTGESYTLPISQITGVHSLSENLMDLLDAEPVQDEGDGQRAPFGFAAYTSLARSEEEEEGQEDASREQG